MASQASVDWTKQLFSDIDKMEPDTFANYFADSGVFSFGAFPAATGRAAIAEFVRNFFSTLASLAHDVIDVYEHGDLLIIRFDVTYTLDGGATVTIPAMETVRRENGLVTEYIIFLDPTPLQALQSKQG